MSYQFPCSSCRVPQSHRSGMCLTCRGTFIAKGTKVTSKEPIEPARPKRKPNKPSEHEPCIKCGKMQVHWTGVCKDCRKLGNNFVRHYVGRPRNG